MSHEFREASNRPDPPDDECFLCEHSGTDATTNGMPCHTTCLDEFIIEYNAIIDEDKNLCLPNTPRQSNTPRTPLSREHD